MLNRSRGGPVAKSGLSSDDVSNLIAGKADKVGSSDIEITDAAKGIILKSPDGTRRRVSMSDDSSLTREVLS